MRGMYFSTVVFHYSFVDAFMGSKMKLDICPLISIVAEHIQKIFLYIFFAEFCCAHISSFKIQVTRVVDKVVSTWKYF